MADFITIPDSDNPTDRQLRSAGSASKFYTSNAISLQRPRVFAEGVVREATAVHGNMPLEPVDEGQIACESAFDYSRAAPLRRKHGDTRFDLRSSRRRKAFIQAQARRNESIKNGLTLMFSRLRTNALQIAGDLPVHDADGNVLSGMAAKVARAKLYNGPICDVFNNTDSPDGTNRRQRCGNYLQAILDAETVDELSEDVDEAKEQLQDQVEEAIRERKDYLFDGNHEPQTDNQDATVRGLSRIRTDFLRQFPRRAMTKTAAVAAKTSALAKIAATAVEGVPVWDHNQGEAIHGNALTSAYTKGTGAAKWKLDLHAFSAANSAAKKLALGDVMLDPFSDENFELSNLANSATDGSLSFHVKRKGSGHPARGSYELRLTARNYNGPSVLVVTVTVS